MVKRLPVSGVCVPVEPGTHALHLDVKVVSDLLLDHLESGRGTRVLGYQVRTLMPRDPLGLPSLTGLLNVSHLIYELIVYCPVVILAEELWHDYDIIMLDFAVDPRLVRPDHDPHAGPHQCALRIKGLCVPPRTPLLLGFPLIFRVFKNSGVVFDLREGRVHFRLG